MWKAPSVQTQTPATEILATTPEARGPPCPSMATVMALLGMTRIALLSRILTPQR